MMRLVSPGRAVDELPRLDCGPLHSLDVDGDDCKGMTTRRNERQYWRLLHLISALGMSTHESMRST